VLQRPGGAFLIGADEWAAASSLPLLFAPQMMRSPTWPLSPGDNCTVSDEDAWDFAELLEIALAELPEEGVAPDLVWAEFRRVGTQRLKALVAFCRGGRFQRCGIEGGRAEELGRPSGGLLIAFPCLKRNSALVAPLRERPPTPILSIPSGTRRAFCTSPKRATLVSRRHTAALPWPGPAWVFSI
jgi:hypothetical protein